MVISMGLCILGILLATWIFYKFYNSPIVHAVEIAKFKTNGTTYEKYLVRMVVSRFFYKYYLYKNSTNYSSSLRYKNFTSNIDKAARFSDLKDAKYAKENLIDFHLLHTKLEVIESSDKKTVKQLETPVDPEVVKLVNLGLEDKHDEATELFEKLILQPVKTK